MFFFKVVSNAHHKHRQRQNYGYITPIQESISFQPNELQALNAPAASIIQIIRPTSRFTERRIRRKYIRGDYNLGYAQIILPSF